MLTQTNTLTSFSQKLDHIESQLKDPLNSITWLHIEDQNVDKRHRKVQETLSVVNYEYSELSAIHIPDFKGHLIDAYELTDILSDTVANPDQRRILITSSYDNLTVFTNNIIKSTVMPKSDQKRIQNIVKLSHNIIKDQ